MKTFRILPVLATLLTAVLLATSAHAGGFLTEFLFNAGANLVRGTVGAASNAVSNAFKSKESTEQKAARQRGEIEQTADQILDQYPPERRAELRPRLIERLNMVYSQHNAIEARQAAINEERYSAGGIVTNAVVSGAGTTIGNRVALSTAGVAASHHVGSGASRIAMDAASSGANTASRINSSGFDMAKMQNMALGANASAQAIVTVQELRDSPVGAERAEVPMTIAPAVARDTSAAPVADPAAVAQRFSQ